jgi:predicted kinase|tara:strand:- start:72 stop:812 length:741 start_codon:yes stop_codon:yes gene_type:complete
MELIKYKEDDLVLDIEEGVNDSGIFKAVILAGGPGSGKSFVARKLGLGSMGLSVVNSDKYFEMLVKRKGLSLKMPDNETEEREVARMAAKGLTDKRMNSLIDARMGIIVDSTSGDQTKTRKIYQLLRRSGYDVKVIFIQTNLEVAQQRNGERERTVPPKVLEVSWKSAQKVKKVLQSMAKRDYHEIENNGGPIDTKIAGNITVWANKLNSTAIEWITHVKNGMDSSVREDINNNMIKSFKEYTSWR